MNEENQVEVVKCGKCGAEVRLIRRLPKVADLPELLTFECVACGHIETTTLEGDF